MSSALANKLTMVRNACDSIKALCQGPEEQLALDQIDQFLSKMIVDASVLPRLEAEAVAGFSQLGLAATTNDYEALSRAVDAQLSGIDLSSEPDKVDFVRRALQIDHRFWQQYEAAIQHELNRPKTTTPAPAGGPTLDHDALCAFLCSAIPGERSLKVREVRTASLGSSKATLLVSLEGSRVLPGEIALRMDLPFNFLRTTVVDEFPALQLLHKHGVPVPQPFAVEPTGKVLGQPFIVCSKVEGRTLGTSYFPPPRNDAVTASIAACLARIHAVPVEGRTRIGAAQPTGQPYVDAEVTRHYETWKALNVTNTSLEAAFAWVRANLASAHGTLTIVHNDYNYHNILIDRDRVTAVLDWEFVHLGNPAADLAYFQDVANRTSGFDFFLAEYERAGGRIPSRKELDFYIVWAHTRFAVMNFQVRTAVDRGDLVTLRHGLADVHYVQKPQLCIGEELGKLLAQKV